MGEVRTDTVGAVGHGNAGREWRARMCTAWRGNAGTGRLGRRGEAGRGNAGTARSGGVRHGETWSG